MPSYLVDALDGRPNRNFSYNPNQKPFVTQELRALLDKTYDDQMTQPIQYTIVKAPAQLNRRIGIKLKTASLVRTRVAGYSQNLDIDAAGLDVLLDTCQFVDAWRDDVPVDAPDKAHHGQGAYGYHLKSLTVRNSFFARNGWQVGKPYPERNRYRHGVYNGDESATLTIDSSLFTNNASCGVQHRGTGIMTATNFVCFGNAFGFINKAKGTAQSKIIGGVIFCNGWNYDVDGNGKIIWNGACGIFADSDTFVDDVDIFLPPKMNSPDGNPVSTPVAKMGNVTFGPNVRVKPWPTYDPTSIIYAVDSGAMSAADAVKQIRDDARKL